MFRAPSVTINGPLPLLNDIYQIWLIFFPLTLSEGEDLIYSLIRTSVCIWPLIIILILSLEARLQANFAAWDSFFASIIESFEMSHFIVLSISRILALSPIINGSIIFKSLAILADVKDISLIPFTTAAAILFLLIKSIFCIV